MLVWVSECMFLCAWNWIWGDLRVGPEVHDLKMSSHHLEGFTSVSQMYVE